MKYLATIMISTTLLAQIPAISTPEEDILRDMGVVISEPDSMMIDSAIFPAEKKEFDGILNLVKGMEEQMAEVQKVLSTTRLKFQSQEKVVDSLYDVIEMLNLAHETELAVLKLKLENEVLRYAELETQKTVSDSSIQKSDKNFAEIETQDTNKLKEILAEKREPAKVIYDEKKQFRAGLANFHGQQYYAAIDKFNDLIKYGHDETIKAKAQYYIGRSYFEKKNYTKALEELESVLKYKSSDYIDDVLALMGLAFEQEKRMADAKTVFEELVSNYPKSDYTPLAQRYIKKLNQNENF